MVAAHVPGASSRSIVAYVLAIIALIIATSVTVLVLLAHSQSDLLRSAQAAGEYHLASTVRAGVIEQHLWEADRLVPGVAAGASAPAIDRSTASALRRLVHFIELETRALEAGQQRYAEPVFAAPLRRLLDESRRFVMEIATLNEPNAATAIRERIDQFRLRLDQFSTLHWHAYLARDTSAARAAGWRQSLVLSLTVSVAGLVLIAIATRQLTMAIHARRMAERRQRRMQSELDHRVKNNLASVLSLAKQTARSSSDLEDFSVAFTGRIVAMARTHEALARTEWTGIDLSQAAALALATHLDAIPSRITIEGDVVNLPADAAMPVCLILHELSTNAAKHGALSAPDGRVALTWARRGARVHVSWVERGGPTVVEPKFTGVGTRLLEGFIRHELRGDIAMDYRSEGLACRFSVPVNGEAAAR